MTGPGAARAVGWEKIDRDLLGRLAAADLAAKGAAKGLRVDGEGRVRVPSFGVDYRVGSDGVTGPGHRPVPFKERLAVASYLLSDGEGEAAGTFVPFGQLGGGFTPGRARQAERGLTGPLAERFGDAPARLARASLAIGGLREPGGRGATHIWRYHAFPQLPLRLTLHEADEDFPAGVQVLFDRRALEFLGLHCLGFLPDYFLDALLRADRAWAEAAPST